MHEAIHIHTHNTWFDSLQLPLSCFSLFMMFENDYLWFDYHFDYSYTYLLLVMLNEPISCLLLGVCRYLRHWNPPKPKEETIDTHTKVSQKLRRSDGPNTSTVTHLIRTSQVQGSALTTPRKLGSSLAYPNVMSYTAGTG